MPIYPFLFRLNIYPIRLIKVNEETGELVRNLKTGLCVICKPGDVGEMVGTISDSDPMLRFEGYVNGSDTKKKIIRDVIQKGDYVFSSGDILYWDKYGYLYFKVIYCKKQLKNYFLRIVEVILIDGKVKIVQQLKLKELFNQ